ncbi:homoserine dehydrogenase/aspartokinase/homoserine dehydrogenase 1 [Flavobacterium sp. HSC-32F16]|uniref:aspartate kinase n=1 Tax=Flavobacterium sp. HSC-32F16 TaxID=2910964 RepID=UPI0020A356D6|nr:aspartate kinase [Flavobacterium sp. HSC-32F16]MCP2026884.1 homoserine dehydrogenase/aspartokinase/homoserine dehydrogenase 1 [Flavobacterium sp. HSC-32F16]
MSKLKINIILFGIGNIGSTLINQIIESQEFFLQSKNVDFHFPIITNSTVAFFEKEGVGYAWETNFRELAVPFRVQDIIEFAKENEFENLIAVDATASDELIGHYNTLIENGFNIVAVNKKANTLPIDLYKQLRENLKKYDKEFLYETSVDTGFPVLQTLRDLYFSGEKITKIRGVFSDNLSYVFNRFSAEENSFSSVLKDASLLGLMRSTFKEDLSGNDTARKLLILTREIGKEFEFSDIKINSLIREEHLEKNGILNKEAIDKSFKIAKITQKDNHVLRYIGEFDVEKNTLEVKLVSEPATSAIGQLKGSDSIFEIYTQSYANTPIVLQSASPCKQAISRGLITDILKVAEKIKNKEAVWL